MRKASHIVLTAIATGSLLVVAAAQAGTPPAKTQATTAAAQARELVQQASRDIGNGDRNAATSTITQVIQSKGFAELPPHLRYRALMIASTLAEAQGKEKQAHAFAVRATAFDEAGNKTWKRRIVTAFFSGDYRDAAHSLAQFAKRWPARLESAPPGLPWAIHYHLIQAGHANADREMLDALFDARWTVHGSQPNPLWRRLALLHIERDQIARATTVAQHVTSGEGAIAMLVDKRFDPITHGNSHFFSVDDLVAARIKRATARSRANPHLLAPIVALEKLYLITGQYARVVSVSNVAVKVSHNGNGASIYTDFANRYRWLLDYRARAFMRQGQWQKAEQTGTSAARLREDGGVNVSQAINLARLYANLKKPEKASDAIRKLGPISPIGHMELELVKLKIAVENKDDNAIATAMADLHKHRKDSIATWQRALLFRGKLDQAAALLVRRLQSPTWRSAALVSMQHYKHGVLTPIEKTVLHNRKLVDARPDVQAALRKVGRVMDWNITPPLH